MGDINPRDLNDEIYARWQRFYRKGLINRRTLMQAAMVWAGATSIGALAACGGDDDSATKTPSSSGAGSTPGASPTGGSGGVAQGGTLRVILSESDLPTMDPHMHNLRTGIIFFYHTHDNLGVRNGKRT